MGLRAPVNPTSMHLTETIFMPTKAHLRILPSPSAPYNGLDGPVVIINVRLTSQALFRIIFLHRRILYFSL